LGDFFLALKPVTLKFNFQNKSVVTHSSVNDLDFSRPNNEIFLYDQKGEFAFLNH
jgi:hypothetical protein